MLNEGKYTARAQSAELGTSPNGSDFTCVEFKIEDGEEAGERISAWLYFTEKTTARSIESLRYCGCTFPNNDLTNFDGLGSKQVQLVVEHEEYDGKTRAKVKWVNAISGVKAEQKMGAAQKNAFRERMKGMLVASKNSDTHESTVTPGDSDIPF